MSATETARVSFPVYRVEHDEFSGGLDVRLSFVRHPEPVTHHADPATGLVDRDTMDGGPAGTITAPAGSILGEISSGETVLVLPDGTTLSAADAHSCARVEDRRQSFGLGWSDARA